MKRTYVLGIALAALGALVAVTPWYLAPVCEVDGLYAYTKTGTQLVMPCGYSARAETFVVAPLTILAGLAIMFSSTMETRRIVGFFGAGLGALALALPTFITGVCKNPTHGCVVETRPALILLGAATVGLSLLVMVRRIYGGSKSDQLH